MLLYVWLVPLLLWLFLLGAAVGSFLNVCIYRVPLGKSLVWPGSHCGHCLHEVRLKDNIPLVSYWVLGGRCRDCGATFSMRYFWVELLTAVAFVALYLLEIGLNVQHLPAWRDGGFVYLEWANAPPHSWQLFIFHALLACFLITATGCLLDRGRVPTGVTVCGGLAGVLAAALFPWPFPQEPASALVAPSRSASLRVYLPVDGGTPARPLRGPMPERHSWAHWPVSPRPGFYPWPVWGPLPAALPPGSWALGLVTGLAGALAGGWGLRVVAAVTRRGLGREAVSARSADLALIAGAFLGWQPVLVAIVLALVVAAPLSVLRRTPPFGLFLAAAVVATWLGWAWVGPLVRPILFSPTLLPPLIAAGLALAGVVSLLARVCAAPAAQRTAATADPGCGNP